VPERAATSAVTNPTQQPAITSQMLLKWPAQYPDPTKGIEKTEVQAAARNFKVSALFLTRVNYTISRPTECRRP
jgi:hypothetical protein